MQHDGPNGHVYLVSAARTPIGKFAGGLSDSAGVDSGGGGSVAMAFERVA